MSKPTARDDQSAKVAGAAAGPMGVFDDDDESEDETDFDEEDEPSVRRHDGWSMRPGFGSPEWWSGT